ncbi:MAG: hypothetical protein RIR26_2954 [Pseudomonadota bacterium]|jgi:hypothetical protein
MALRRIAVCFSTFVAFWGASASVMASSAEADKLKRLASLDSMSTGSQSEYFQVLGKLEQMDALGQKASLISPEFFQSLNWIGRTACVNYVCSVMAIEQCRRVLDTALRDEALVVRDHGLRILLSSRQFTTQEKRLAAERSVSDDRNYRKGRPFWIVDRARTFLSAELKTSVAD